MIPKNAAIRFALAFVALTLLCLCAARWEKGKVRALAIVALIACGSAACACFYLFVR